MKQTILIVEDDAAARSAFAEAVEAAGFLVLLAEHGLRAIDLFQTHLDEVSVVITDINMPLMSGTELIKYLRALKPEIKIIYMSGFPQGTEGAGDLLESNAVVLHKPFSSQVFLSTIREVVTGRLTVGYR